MDQQTQREGQTGSWAVDPGLGCRPGGPSEQPHVAGAMKAGDRDVDGPVLIEQPFRIEWYEFRELTCVSAARAGDW